MIIVTPGAQTDASKLSKFLPALLLGVLSGCATVSEKADSNDPWEGFNRKVYAFNDSLDRHVLRPVSEAYDEVTPEPVNRGISNVFSNVNDVFVTLNDLLQAKFKQAGSDAGRFLVNSTLGMGGMVDWASGWGMKKHEEDFGQTLAYWGVGEGPYLVIPFFGPRTMRDTGGVAVDTASNPISLFAPIAAILSTGAVYTVDQRADLLTASELVEAAALDPYLFTREAYLQRRRFLVYDGDPPQEEFEEFEEGPEEGGMQQVLGGEDPAVLPELGAKRDASAAVL